MKKITFIFTALLLSAFSFAQSDSSSTCKKRCQANFYTSVGISVGHVDPTDAAIDNFNKASYPSLEIGICRNNVSLGAVFGCENMFIASNSRGFYELKSSICTPIGNCSGYALFGVGAYFENEFNNFIEYGAGFSYAPTKLGYFVQYSNWARTNYISAGLTYNF